MPIPHVNAPEENISTTTVAGANMPDKEVMPLICFDVGDYIRAKEQAKEKEWREKEAALLHALKDWRGTEADWLESCCSYDLFIPTMPQVAQAFINHIAELRQTKETGGE